MIMQFLASKWALITSIIYLLINIGNLATTHWSDKKGVVRWVAFVVEILSILVSRDAAGLFKLPLTSEKPGETKVPIPPTLKG